MMKSDRSKKTAGCASIQRIMAALLVIVLSVGALQTPFLAEAASKVTCKKLCKAALNVTGGSSKLQYQTTKALEFPGFSASDAEDVSSIAYLCDEKEVYCICVAKASSKSKAKDLLNSLKAYHDQGVHSDYLDDYSNNEQKVIKNAVYGRKGRYVWYIAMSTKKSVNKKGQTKIKEQL